MKPRLSGDALVIAGTAAIGSYTTFSTWMLETQRLAEDGEGRSGLANIVVSMGVGLAAAAAQRFRSDRLVTLSEDLPVVSVAVDTRERIEAVLGVVEDLHGDGLVTLERARLLSGEIGPVALPEELHEATKLTVYVSRQERAHRTPALRRGDRPDRVEEPAFASGRAHGA